MVSRRSTLRYAAGSLGATGLAGCGRPLDTNRPSERFGLDPNPLDLPSRQHAWNATLRSDDHGNDLPPQYHRVLLLDLDGAPSAGAARTVEFAMRSLEEAFEWSPDGLLHLLMWGPDYFERLGVLDRAPLRRPSVISRTDDPELLSHDAALVLASDGQSRLSAAEAAMFEGRDRLAEVEVEHRLGDVFSIVGRRTGFIGAGLPAEHATAEGVPDDAPLSDDVPMFMGFFSGMQRTQASEDRVTIDSGRFAGGTTAHLSHLSQSLDRWYNVVDEVGRAAMMFSPLLSPADIEGLADGASLEELIDSPVDVQASEHGVVGHLEKVMRARKDGEPLLLRRDFNTVDGGRAGVHFLSLQRKLAHFEEARDAMNGWWLRNEHGGITDRKNNGILDFVTVRSRANFYVPPRNERSFPLFEA